MDQSDIAMYALPQNQKERITAQLVLNVFYEWIITVYGLIIALVSTISAILHDSCCLYLF
jgi:hypothetical protein